ncbi:MAG: hypothetical protein ABL871_03185 [Terricaulis sp.]
MMGRLFPRSLDNSYEGSWVAVWLFAPVLIVKTLMGFNFSGLNPIIDVSEILRTVDGVPLDTFSQEAAASVVDSAAAWGMALFTLCLFAWLVLFRYRAALPFAILLLLIEQVGRTGPDTVRVVTALIAGSSTMSMGAIINLTMSTLLIVVAVLSLLRVRRAGSDSA